MIEIIFELKEDKPQLEKNFDVLFEILGNSKMEQSSLTQKVFLVHLLRIWFWEGTKLNERRGQIYLTGRERFKQLFEDINRTILSLPTLNQMLQ